MLVTFPLRTPPAAARPFPVQACPLCGRWLFRAASHDHDRCTIGQCRADVSGDPIQAARIESNRQILRHDLIEVEFSLAALRVAVDLARRMGRPCGVYLEQKIPLVYRRTVLTAYVGDVP